MTNLYEAGDINTVDSDEQVDINASDDPGRDDEGNDAHGNEPNEAFDGGTPLAVLSYLARSLSNEPDAVVIDSAEATASAVAGVLHSTAPASTPATFTCYATDSVEKFQRLGSRFLGQPIPKVELLDLGG